MLYTVETLFTGLNLSGGNLRQVLVSDTDGTAINDRFFYVVNNKNPIVNRLFIFDSNSNIEIKRIKIETLGAKGLRVSPIPVPSFVAENYCGNTVSFSLRQTGNASPLHYQKTKIPLLNEWVNQNINLSYFGNPNFSNERYFQLSDFTVSYDALDISNNFVNAEFSIKIIMEILVSSEVLDA